jgi:hypothetical protein
VSVRPCRHASSSTNLAIGTSDGDAVRVVHDDLAVGRVLKEARVRLERVLGQVAQGVLSRGCPVSERGGDRNSATHAPAS